MGFSLGPSRYATMYIMLNNKMGPARFHRQLSSLVGAAKGPNSGCQRLQARLANELEWAQRCYLDALHRLGLRLHDSSCRQAAPDRFAEN